MAANSLVIFILIFLAVLFSSCGNSGAGIINTYQESNQGLQDILQFDTTNDNSSFEWLSRIDVRIPSVNAVPYTNDLDLIWSFDYDGGEISANVIFENGLNGVAEMGLLILCDGIPITYRVEDHVYDNKNAIQIINVENEVAINVVFTPIFTKGIGRIDFIQFNQPRLNGVQYHANSMTFIVRNKEHKYKTEDTLEIKTYNARPLIGLDNNTPYDSWIWELGHDYSQRGAPGVYTVHLDRVPEFVFEAVIGTPGSYYTMLFMDYVLIEPYNGIKSIEWTTDGIQSLVYNLNLSELLERNHTFFSITFSHEADPLLIQGPYISRKTELIY